MPRKRSGRIQVDGSRFVIQAQNREDVLARVVLLFHRLNIEITSLYMVRRRDSETMRMMVTVEADRERAVRVEAHLYKVVQVKSVRIESAGKEEETFG